MRKALLGAELSISEKEHWVAAISDFFKPPEESQTRQRSKKLFAPLPRLAALEFCRGIDNALRVGVGRRLSYYRVKSPGFEERLGAEDPITVGGMSCLCPARVINMGQCPHHVAATSFFA